MTPFFLGGGGRWEPIFGKQMRRSNFQWKERILNAKGEAFSEWGVWEGAAFSRYFPRKSDKKAKLRWFGGVRVGGLQNKLVIISLTRLSLRCSFVLPSMRNFQGYYSSIFVDFSSYLSTCFHQISGQCQFQPVLVNLNQAMHDKNGQFSWPQEGGQNSINQAFLGALNRATTPTSAFISGNSRRHI